MVISFCKAENFQQITNIRENVNLVRFDMEPIMQEVYVDGEPTGEWEESGYVKYVEAFVTGEITPEVIINLRLEALKQYDESEDINSLYVNGKRMWFDKVTRTCISYSMQVEKESGSTTTTLFDNDNVAYTLPIDLALGLFAQLELYAKACYNVTASHKAAISALTSVEDVLNYNIKTGYPEKLVFNSTEQDVE